MNSRFLQLLWRRPQGRVEWGFTLALIVMTVAGSAWLLTHASTENREALSGWLAVLGGETTLKLKTPDYIRGGLMLTACAWVVIGLGLWLTRFWWWRQRPASLCFSAPTATQPVAIFDKRFLIGVGVILLLALGIRWPRLDLGLYNDEIDVFRTSIAGSFDGRAFLDATTDDLPKYRPVSWRDTFWGNRVGNNHALHSILARSLYDLWRRASGAPEGTIKEWPLRLPALLGGLASIAVIAALARLATGSARAGLFAAFFLAVHPWHLRYSTEARGYGLVFAFGALAVLFLSLAARRGKWRWWLAFGAAQAATLWACVGSLHLILAINLCAAAFFLWPGKNRFEGDTRINPLRSNALPSWIVANLLSAAFFLLAAAPALPLIRLAVETNPTFSQGVAGNWWRDVLSYYLVGMPWTDGDPGNPFNPAMTKYLGNVFVLGGFGLAIALALTGAARLCRRGGFTGRLAVIGPALAVFLSWLASTLGDATLLKWYTNFATVFVGLWMGVGLDAWISRKSPASASPTRDRVSWRRLATYALLGLYVIGVARPLIIYRRHSKQAIRESAVFIRGGVYPFTEEQRRPLVAAWWTHANFYDPYLRIGHTPENLQIMVARARREQRPLYYILGARPRALAEDPRIVERLEDSGEFTLERVFHGMEEEQFNTRVFRLRKSRGPTPPNEIPKTE